MKLNQNWILLPNKKEMIRYNKKDTDSMFSFSIIKGIGLRKGLLKTYRPNASYVDVKRRYKTEKARDKHLKKYWDNYFNED